MKKALIVSVSILPWLISCLCVVLVVRGFLDQAAIQTDLNMAMKGVQQNLRTAGALTVDTARSLEPMAGTAQDLQGMNTLLRQTRDDVAAMNRTMAQLVAEQESILAQLAGLGTHTATVVERLEAVGAQNEKLLGVTGGVTAKTGEQASAIGELADLTEAAIAQLAQVNRRLAFLR